MRLLIVAVVCIGLLSAAVERWALPLGGARLERHAKRYATPVSLISEREYPRELADTDGLRVRLAKPPQRIASQYWSIEEFVYSVVPPQRVVAVSESAFVASVSNVQQQVKRYQPARASDPERVVSLRPDLVLVSSSGRVDYTNLVRSTGVPVYRMFTDFVTLAQIEEHILLTGYLTGEDERAVREAQRFRTVIQQAQARRPAGSAPPRVLGLGGRYSYGSHTLFHDVVTTLGGINVGAENGLTEYEAVSSEQIASWNPEWIIVGADRGRTAEVLQRLLADPAIAVTQAARNKRIVVLDYNVFLPLSPYSSGLVTALAEALWP